MLKLDLDTLTVDSFNTSELSAPTAPRYMYAQESQIRYTVLRHTEQVSCYASDCGTCGGTECWA
jgi:hypothetical protein